MKLVSVNISLPTDVEYNGQTISTGIFKEPVSGRVLVEKTNLAGDGQADLTVHGGEFKAVYVYPYKHYDWWQQQLQRNDFAYGQFGENFTVAEMMEDAVHIGDQFQIGSAVVQVTQPREPCYKLAIRMGRPEFPKLFLASGRVGFYLRVLQTGDVGAGDTIELIQNDPEGISITEAWRLMYYDKNNLENIQRLLKIESLGPQWRKSLEKRLQQAQNQ